MSGFFIAEEGPLAGMVISFEEGVEENTWTLGRDPETSEIALEDPMVSRRHATVTLTPEGFILENLSTVNPVTQNGMVVAEPVLLKEGDILQIGSTFFRFTEKPQEVEEAATFPLEEMAKEKEPPATMASEIHFGPSPDTRWLLKVISGPNAGAEFAMHRGATYLIGKDPNICDIVFQDLSVSRQHARLSLDKEDNVFIEDLGSRNGVIVNGELITEKQLLSSQDLVALGTTTFLVVDRLEARETIISPPAAIPTVPTLKKEEEKAAAAAKRDWKELVIPKRHLAIAGVFAALLFTGIFAMLSLFKAETVIVKKMDAEEKIHDVIAGPFPEVQFSFNEPSGKIFLVGHVLTTVQHQELLYLLRDMPMITEIKDNVVVDELVWQSFNGLLSTNPAWVGVSMYGPSPGQFVLRGYVETVEEAEELSDYVVRNFDYLNQLNNEVVIEKNLELQVESMLLDKGFTNVAFTLSNGELVLTGRVASDKENAFTHLTKELEDLRGMRVVKDFVVVTSQESSRIDITNDFQVTGYSMRDDEEFFVVINGRILAPGDLLNGMLITAIKPNKVLLQKEGVLYRIDYNIQ